jgi:hypothetical protein
VTAKTKDYESAETGHESVSGNVLIVVDEIFRRHGQVSPLSDMVPASDEADDLVASLTIRERLDRSTDAEAMSLEDSLRAHGLDPADFGLE